MHVFVYVQHRTEGTCHIKLKRIWVVLCVGRLENAPKFCHYKTYHKFTRSCTCCINPFCISDTICVRCTSTRDWGRRSCFIRRNGVTFSYYRSSLILAALHGGRVSSVMRININAPFRTGQGFGVFGTFAVRRTFNQSTAGVLMDAHYSLRACVCVWVPGKKLPTGSGVCVASRNVIINLHRFTMLCEWKRRYSALLYFFFFGFIDDVRMIVAVVLCRSDIKSNTQTSNLMWRDTIYM